MDEKNRLFLITSGQPIIVLWAEKVSNFGGNKFLNFTRPLLLPIPVLTPTQPTDSIRPHLQLGEGGVALLQLGGQQQHRLPHVAHLSGFHPGQGVLAPPWGRALRRGGQSSSHTPTFPGVFDCAQFLRTIFHKNGDYHWLGEMEEPCFP